MFDADRWARAGARPKEIEALSDEYAALPTTEQGGMDRWMAAVSDADLLEHLKGRRAAEKEDDSDGDEAPPPGANQGAPAGAPDPSGGPPPGDATTEKPKGQRGTGA